MSIGHIKNGQDLFEFLKIDPDIKFEGEQVGGFLPRLFEACAEIWKRPEETKYPDHGIGHSLRIISFFLDLAPLYDEWSDIEKLLFATVALIHDLGMQFNNWRIDSANFKEGHFQVLNRGHLNPKEVRELHEQILCELVLAQTEGKLDKVSSPPPLFRSKNISEGILMNLAATIAACHRNTGYQKKLEEESPNGKYAESETPWGSIRPRLLAGLIRLCDALDGSVDRLDNLEYLDGISNRSKSHWLACLFISRIKVEIVGQGKGMYAKLIHSWRIPLEATENQQFRISHFIDKERIGFLNREIQEIGDFYRRAREGHHIREIVAEKRSGEPIREVLNPGFDIYRFIPALEQEISQIISQNQEVNNTTEKNLRSSQGNTLQKELLDWYEEYKTVGHFELTNGEHTDTLLQLRTLASNPNLLSLIVEYLADQYKRANIFPSLIMAVGTSAIPISVNLSLKLKCASTFTFYTGTYQHTYTGKYQGPKRLVVSEEQVTFENRPKVKDGDTIVIIDDVISGGFAASIALETIAVANPNVKIKAVYHQAIFKLGRRQIKKPTVPPGIRKFFHIVHIPDIYYADKFCDLCDSGGTASPEQ